MVVAAAPVFQLFGKDSITTAEMPPLGQQRIVGQTGYHIRSGGHGLGDEDWWRESVRGQDSLASNVRILLCFESTGWLPPPSRSTG
jgi:hypothetical protein